MTIDPKCAAWARVWLMNTGWTHTADVQRLAERIQDCCEDFEADLLREYNEASHDRSRPGS